MNQPRPGRKRMFAVPAAIAGIAAVAVLSTQQFQGDDEAPEPPRDDATVLTATVQTVSDGDTVRVRLDGESERVRILGLDAPEVHTSRDCGGPESSDHLEALLSVGEEVSLIADPSQSLYDQYGRILAYVENSDGVDVGSAQIEAGWARVYRKGSRIEKFDEYQRAESQARSAQRGIWGAC